MTVAANSLPPPHFIGWEDETVVSTTPATQLPFHHVPDAQLDPRRLRAAWSNVPRALADVIATHFDEHGHGVFQLTIPRTGEVVRLTWVGPPSIQWTSHVFAASVTAEFEEALAYD